uniref:TIR domain-containing protein n=1 Tax=Fagus sylvatica TaxID=28930 RepID=A0A2N9IYM4_FAGSY
MDYEGNTKKRKRSSSADTAGSSSSTFAPVSGGEYEVFLSFRGEDTRKTFTDHLYNALVQVGIRTFRDNEELPVGEEIRPALLKAIKESIISIPIFSKGYASSKWCLRELAKMVECHNDDTMKQKILPIFYDVEPSDVRHQTGTYEKAFRQHLKHFDKKTVQGWKEAMREVGEMKGWELKKETNGHEGELVKRVVSKVLLELKKNYMVVTDNLVGIYHHEEEMTKLLHVGSNGVHIVGIYGMGGIGKTTIAKVIYNKFSVHFDCFCFLSNVRETLQQHNGLLILQNQLISTIKKEKKEQADNVDEGINMIKRIFCNKKVFIVLDDVDDKSQFDKIVGKRDWFGLGSRIIITTRDKHVLILLKANETYEPPIMEPCHSLQLFSKHAFMRESPPEDYHDISKCVVSTAAGLPLALEIIGSFLFGKEKAAWESTLRKLKEIPDDNVQEKLRISYKALDNSQQQIFLDIACFFIGVDKRLPFYFWDDSEFFPIIAVEVLQLKSLVKMGDDNILRMHDQLRDLGRQIVREKNLNDPGEHSRLFRHNEALDVLVKQMGTRNVEALELRSPYCFTAEEFKELRNLRDIGKSSQLETLSLISCYKLRTLPTEIGAISRLKDLKLRSCKNLQCILALPPSLFTIHVEDCESLKRLPDLSNLKKLQRIDIVKCKNLIKIQGFGKLELFTSLNISDCESLERLPDVSNLRMLKDLHIYGCQKLVEIEGLGGGLKSLEKLGVLLCTSLERLDLSGLKNLKELKILDCKNLTEIQGLEELESLGFLNMAGCKLIEKLPDLSNLKKLKILLAVFCEKLTEIRGLEELKSLKLLDISGCKSIERLPDLSNTRIDTNSSMGEDWESESEDRYVEPNEWSKWESEEWKIPCSPIPWSPSSSSSPR